MPHFQNYNFCFKPLELYHFFLKKTTCRIFLGFQFLTRNEERNGIPHEETRKIRGIFSTLRKYLIITKSDHKISNPKSTQFLVKFLAPQTIFILFLCINFFQIEKFSIFLPLFFQFSSLFP